MYELSLNDTKRMDAAVKDAVEYFAGGISLELVKKYILSLGYAMLFFDCQNGSLPFGLDLKPYEHDAAFTVYSRDEKVVYINRANDEETSVLAALAEIGNIVLGYVDSEISFDRHNARKRYMEANAFAYLVLKGINKR